MSKRPRPACNYVVSLKDLKHFEETKSLLRKMMPVARRVLGESSEITLRIRWLTRTCSSGTPTPRSTISARP